MFFSVSRCRIKREWKVYKENHEGERDRQAELIKTYEKKILDYETQMGKEGLLSTYISLLLSLSLSLFLADVLSNEIDKMSFSLSSREGELARVRFNLSEYRQTAEGTPCLYIYSYQLSVSMLH